MTSRSIARGMVLLIAAAVLLADQLSKAWMSANLAGGQTIKALPGLLDLHLVHNSGAAFSLFSGSTLMLGLLSLIVGGGILIWILRQRRILFWQGMAVAFLLGGTLGNGLDRWRLGHVVDFLALVPIDFPIFNVADIAINLAVVCFVIDLLTNRGGSRDG